MGLLKWADKHYLICQPLSHPRQRERVKTEEGLSTQRKGTDGSGQMWGAEE